MTEQSVSELKAALAAAKVEVGEAVRRLAPKHVGGEMEAYKAAFRNLLDTERKLAEAENRPYALPQDCSLRWSVGAPLPILLQSDQETFLFFLLSDDDEMVGQIEFELCLSTTFGGPGDETYKGHPLAGSGFEGHEAMRVVNSPWIQQLKKIDSVHSRHDPTYYDLSKHFIFPFHDSTFECVARSFKASKAKGPLLEAVKEAVSRLR